MSDHCAHGHCVEQYGAGEPHLPILEALTDLSRRDPSLVELIRAVAPTWLFQLPWLSSPEEREALRRELSGAGQARMLREMGELLDRYTEQRPLLLVTEDLHWSDHATVQLIDYLARRRSAARLLWLGSFRVTELIAAEHPLATVRHELRLHGLGAELPLDDFTVAEVGEYVAARVPSLAVEPAIVRALHDRTDGLPLFVAGVIDDFIADPARTAIRTRGSPPWRSRRRSRRDRTLRRGTGAGRSVRCSRPRASAACSSGCPPWRASSASTR